MSVYWIGSPKFTQGHPAKVIAIVHHRMVGTLRGTDSAFLNPDGREASTNFGVGYNCARDGHPQGIDDAHVHQYVRLGDQAWGNGNWHTSGRWNNLYPTTLINSRTVSIEHHDNGGRDRGNGKGVVPEQVIAASIALDRLLRSGSLADMRAAGIRFRSGLEDEMVAELHRVTLDPTHIIDHHFISGDLKPYCWRPWADDPIGFPQARYIAALGATPEVPDVPSFKAYATPKFVTVPDKAWLYVNPDLSPNPGNVQISPGPRDMPVSGKQPDGTLIVGYVDATPGEPELPTYYFAGTPKDYPVAPPPDCTAQVAAARDEGRTAGIASEKERIALAEADRVRAI